jgi:hypothetical protein
MNSGFVISALGKKPGTDAYVGPVVHGVTTFVNWLRDARIYSTRAEADAACVALALNYSAYSFTNTDQSPYNYDFCR